MTRLLIVDQVPSLPKTMAATLGQQHTIEVVGIVSTIEEALASLERCDTIVVSATLPEGGALELIRAVVNLDPWVRVLVTNLAEAQDATDSYIEAGAMGWVI